MNRIFIKISSYFLLIVYPLLSSACLRTYQNDPPHFSRVLHSQNLSGSEIERFDPDYHYTVYLKESASGSSELARPSSGAQNKIKAIWLRQEGDLLRIQTKGSGATQLISLHEIREIQGQGKRREGSYAGLGAAVGGLTGLLGAGLATGLSIDCSGSQNGDSGDCKGLKTVGILVFGGLGGLAGAILGGGVGYLIPKRSKITLTPDFSFEKKGARAGLGVSVSY